MELTVIRCASDGAFYIDLTHYVFWMESAKENLAAQLVGRPPGKPDTRIVLQESLWSLREFIYVNLSECHFHRVGVGYCECSDFAAAFTEFENLAIPAD